MRNGAIIHATETKCRCCFALNSSGGFLCWACVDRLGDAFLGRGDRPGLTWSIDRLAEAAYGEATLSGGGSKRGQGDEFPMVLNQKAADLLHRIGVQLGRWVIDLEPQAHPRGKAHSSAVFLGKSLSRVLSLEHCAAILKEVELFNRDALDLINRPPSRYCGPCQGNLESGEVCGFELRAAEDERSVACRRCGAVHDVKEIRDRLLSRIDEHPQSGVMLFDLFQWLGQAPARREFFAKLAMINPRMYLQANGERNLRRLPDSVALYSFGDVVAAINTPTQDSDSGENHRRRRRPVRKGTQ